MYDRKPMTQSTTNGFKETTLLYVFYYKRITVHMYAKSVTVQNPTNILDPQEPYEPGSRIVGKPRSHLVDKPGSHITYNSHVLYITLSLLVMVSCDFCLTLKLFLGYWSSAERLRHAIRMSQRPYLFIYLTEVA